METAMHYEDTEEEAEFMRTLVEVAERFAVIIREYGSRTYSHLHLRRKRTHPL